MFHSLVFENRTTRLGYTLWARRKLFHSLRQRRSRIDGSQKGSLSSCIGRTVMYRRNSCYKCPGGSRVRGKWSARRPFVLVPEMLQTPGGVLSNSRWISRLVNFVNQYYPQSYQVKPQDTMSVLTCIRRSCRTMSRFSQLRSIIAQNSVLDESESDGHGRINALGCLIFQADALVAFILQVMPEDSLRQLPEYHGTRSVLGRNLLTSHNLACFSMQDFPMFYLQQSSHQRQSRQ